MYRVSVASGLFMTHIWEIIDDGYGSGRQNQTGNFRRGKEKEEEPA